MLVISVRVGVLVSPPESPMMSAGRVVTRLVRPDRWYILFPCPLIVVRLLLLLFLVYLTLFLHVYLSHSVIGLLI